jgi:hypothetical protein
LARDPNAVVGFKADATLDKLREELAKRVVELRDAGAPFGRALRLIAAWLDRAVDDPDFPYRVTLADMLTEDNIAIVRKPRFIERLEKSPGLDICHDETVLI